MHSMLAQPHRSGPSAWRSIASTLVRRTQIATQALPASRQSGTAATPHHSWERGTNESTNGLIRQYLPKRCSMAKITQHHCNVIANKLNARPRKRLDYQTPAECFYGN